jgi:hypothetical protein
MEREQTGLSTAEMARAGARAEPGPGEHLEQGRQPAGDGSPGRAPLFREADAGEYRRRWDTVQAGFVDDPRRTVEQADTLVAEVMQRLAQGFAEERSKLEGQWARGDNVNTEDLRQALRRYRSFFDRLLTV